LFQSSTKVDIEASWKHQSQSNQSVVILIEPQSSMWFTCSSFSSTIDSWGEGKISTMTLRCNIDRIWWDLIHAQSEKNRESRRRKNNLFDVTLTGEKNCCFRPKSDKPNNISGTCRKKI
jgi:hypothetical protein